MQSVQIKSPAIDPRKHYSVRRFPKYSTDRLDRRTDFPLYRLGGRITAMKGVQHLLVINVENESINPISPMSLDDAPRERVQTRGRVLPLGGNRAVARSSPPAHADSDHRHRCGFRISRSGRVALHPSPAASAHRPLQSETSPRRARRKLCRSQHDGIQLPALLRPAEASRWTAACGRRDGAVCSSGHLRRSPARPEQTDPSHRTHPAVLQQSDRYAGDHWTGRWQLTTSESSCPVVCRGGGAFGLPRFLDDIDCNPYVAHPVPCGHGGIESTACTVSIDSKSLIRTACPVESSSSLPGSCVGRKNASCNYQTELYCCKPFMHVRSPYFAPQVKKRDRQGDPFKGIESTSRIRWRRLMAGTMGLPNSMQIELPVEPLSHQRLSHHVFPWPVRVLQ
jgi:hypothetical protein